MAYFPFSTQDLAYRLLMTAVILGVTYLLDLVFGKIVIRAIGRRNRSSAFEIDRVGSLIIWVGGILSVLPVLGASETVIAVVILLIGGFLILSTKDLSSNWFAGQMIKTITPFKVGDWIRLSDSYGRVTKIESLYTTLVSSANETVMIPNSRLTSDVIVDRTTGGSIKVPIEIDVDRSIEFGQLTHSIMDIANDLSQYLSEVDGFKRYPPEIYVLSHDQGYARIRVILRIDNPAREDEVASEFRKRFASLGMSPRSQKIEGTPEELRATP
ncbi:MAG TPA: mechanosensitive ion channel family protein [Nitrososphaerales archaeon]|nr:mechanosensitive ion channel family protein [Nitrososphaerales archaeon]